MVHKSKDPWREPLRVSVPDDLDLRVVHPLLTIYKVQEMFELRLGEVPTLSLPEVAVVFFKMGYLNLRKYALAMRMAEKNDRGRRWNLADVEDLLHGLAERRVIGQEQVEHGVQIIWHIAHIYDLPQKGPLQ